jgi:hypothetical protein
LGAGATGVRVTTTHASGAAYESQRAMFEENLAAGVTQDEEGAFEMVRAARDWGFEIEDVKQPFDVFYGDADEVLAPEMAARAGFSGPDARFH